jgi:hypothetical protein
MAILPGWNDERIMKVSTNYDGFVKREFHAPMHPCRDSAVVGKNYLD